MKIHLKYNWVNWVRDKRIIIDELACCMDIFLPSVTIRKWHGQYRDSLINVTELFVYLLLRPLSLKKEKEIIKISFDPLEINFIMQYFANIIYSNQNWLLWKDKVYFWQLIFTSFCCRSFIWRVFCIIIRNNTEFELFILLPNWPYRKTVIFNK